MSSLVSIQQSRSTSQQGGLILPHIILRSGVPQMHPKHVRGSGMRDGLVAKNVLNPIGVII
jgi:hypothetical protein